MPFLRRRACSRRMRYIDEAIGSGAQLGKWHPATGLLRLPKGLIPWPRPILVAYSADEVMAWLEIERLLARRQRRAHGFTCKI
jgi:hypothetical protein